jgi:opacity protein-like surface antigen
MTTRVPTTTRVLLAMLAGWAVLLAAGVGSAAAAHDSAQPQSADCYKQVINDWENNGRIDNIYAPPCYTQAIQHLNQYPDIKGYSNVIQDIQAALYAVLHEEGRGGGGGPSGPTSSPSTNLPGTSTSKSDGGPINWLSNHLAPGNAQSVPLPLLVLGGLALLLLLAAAGTWLARRIQTNRMKPRPPAPQPRRST